MISLNLLPRNMRRQKETGWWRIGAVALALIVLVSLGVWQFQVGRQVQQLETSQAALQNEVNLLQSDIQLDRRLRTQKAELERALSVEATLRERFVPWSELLARVLYQLPQPGGKLGISLTRLQASQTAEPGPNPAYDEQVVEYEFTLQGNAVSQTAIIELVKAYETAPGFAINFQRAERDIQTGLVNFAAVVGLIREGGEAPETETP